LVIADGNGTLVVSLLFAGSIFWTAAPQWKCGKKALSPLLAVDCQWVLLTSGAVFRRGG